MHLDRTGYPLVPDGSRPSGWRVRAQGDEPQPDEAQRGEPCLAAWLAERGAAPLSERYPVLAYGSNACPSKITWLREQLGLRGPAVVLRARCAGLAAVWSSGFRPRDGQRPAVLAAHPGTEEHTVWFVTDDQRRVLDRCEARDVHYRLVRLGPPAACIMLECGTVPEEVLAYSAASSQVSPLLVDGRMVRCAELDQRVARELRGEPASEDGLACTEVAGEPYG